MIVQPAGGVDPGVLTASSDVSWAKGIVSENRPRRVDLAFDASHLSPGTYNGSISVTAGGTTQVASIVLSVVSPVIKQIVADPVRPLVYALQQLDVQQAGDNKAGLLLVLDATSGKVIRQMDASRVYGLALSGDGNSLYGVTFSDSSMIGYDLERMVRKDTPFVLPGLQTPFGTTPVIHMQCGPGQVIYYIDSSGTLVAFSLSSGQVIQRVSAPRPGLFFRLVTVSKDEGIVRADLGSNNYTGPLNEPLASYSIGADGTLSAIPARELTTVRPTEGGQFASPAFLSNSEDGSVIGYGDRLFKAGRPVSESVQFLDQVTSIAPGGEFLMAGNTLASANGDGWLVPGMTFGLYYSFPSAITQEGNVFYGKSDGGIGFYAARAALGNQVCGFSISPASGNISTPSTFRWLPVDGAREYRLYLSQNASALAVQNPAGPDVLEVRTNRHRVPNPAAMTPGQTWTWRVDAVAPGGLVRGEVKTFTTTSLQVDQSRLDLTVVKGCKAQPAVLHFSSPVALSWTASSDQNWLTLDALSGTTPGSLGMHINTTLIPGAEGTATVTIQAVGVAMKVPVHVSLQAMYSEVNGLSPCMISVPKKDTAFALLHAATWQTKGSQDYLVRIDPLTGDLLEGVHTGFWGNRLRLSPDQSQVGVESISSSNEVASFAIFDVATLAPQKTLLTYLDNYSYDLGTALGPNQMAMFDGRLIHWQDGEIRGQIAANTSSAYYTAFSPDGKYIYGSGYETVSKRDATRSNLPEVKTITGVRDSNSLGVFASGDGSVFAMANKVFDADLNVLATAGGTILAMNRGGSLLFTQDGIFSIPEMRLVAKPAAFLNQPVFADNEAQMLSFVPSVNGVAKVSLFSYKNDITPNPASLVPGTADGALVGAGAFTLTWNDVLKAGRYHVFFGTDRDQVANARFGDATELGTTTATSWATPLNLVLGAQYYWKIIMEGVEAQASSPVWSFHTSSFTVDTQSISTMSVKGGFSPVYTVHLSCPSGTTWVSGGSSSWLAASASGQGSGAFNVTATPGSLAEGTYTASVNLTIGSESVAIPVTFRIVTYHVLAYTPDPSRACVHLVVGLGGQPPLSPIATERFYLARLDAVTHRVSEIFDTGFSGMDALGRAPVVHPEDDQLYLPNAAAKFFRINRSRYAFDTSLDVSVITNAPHGANLSSGCSAGPGKIAIPEVDGITIFSTVTGAQLSRVSVEASGYNPTIRAAPGGRRIYCDRGSLSRPLVYFDIGDDGSISAPGGSALVGTAQYNLLQFSQDGNVIYWNGNYYDKDLRFLSAASAEVRATTVKGLNTDGTLVNLDDTSIVARDGSRTYRTNATNSLSEALSVGNPATDEYFVSNSSDKTYYWKKAFKPGEAGLPVIGSQGWLTEGSTCWAGDPAQPGTLVCGNPAVAECSKFLYYSFLGIRAPSAGFIRFEWRKTGTNETFTFSGARTGMATAPSGGVWQSQTLSVQAGVYMQWFYYNNTGVVNPLASAGIRNITFTPDVQAGAAITSVVSGPDVDGDHDGFSDLVEAALGTDPASASSRPVADVSVVNGQASFVFEHSVDSSYQVTVQISDDLLNWQDLSNSATTRSVIDDGLIERVQVPLAKGKPGSFVRLKVTADAGQ